MDTRTKRMGQTNTDKNKKRKNWVHAFKTPFFIDIQQDMVKDKVSPTFGETQCHSKTQKCCSAEGLFVYVVHRPVSAAGRRIYTKYEHGDFVEQNGSKIIKPTGFHL